MKFNFLIVLFFLVGCASTSNESVKKVRFADVYHIMVMTEKDAKDVYAELQLLDKGEQFVAFKKLAENVSIDTASAGNGGKLDTIYEGMMDLEFEQHVFSSQKSEVIPEFKSFLGWHVIYVEKFYERDVYDICENEAASHESGERTLYSIYCL
ncbi:Putative peptidyl-prolyl cis-trans isomerase Cbf2 precursor [Grimontia celer]|uniref:peptidylprolyl isomerase n=1 Tax=Grimontia celer TaxID=1796497 RepID=A0A128EUX1_9GAMM|nr:peptidylprolyl isomerase [Grimontia celer]CZF78392.1 Putative peptidyl-prolyl cis-trans isomerase Cbf2 precursor [Grimontia celer]